MIVSSIMGRVRFQDENLKKQEVSDAVKKLLGEAEGIEDIRINLRIGSLLISYDEKKVSLLQIADMLKQHIDIAEKPREKRMSSSDCLDGARQLLKKGMENGRGSKSSRGQRGSGLRGQNSCGVDKSIDTGNLANVLIDNFTSGGIVRTLVYSGLGVLGYKKGKSVMQGKGIGKKKN